MKSKSKKLANHCAMIPVLTGVLAMTSTAVSCGEDGPDPDPQPGKPASRTVLVYMVANNSLGTGGYDGKDINEMQKAVSKGDTGNGRLVVYRSPAGNRDVELVEITASGEKVLKTYTDAELSVSSKRMAEVLSDIKTLAPANDYGLVLWSHGSGWIEDGMKEVRSAHSAIAPGNMHSSGSEQIPYPGGLSRQEESIPFSFGVDKGERMNVSTLATTLRNAPVSFSFIYFDCCYMGSIEVLYEMRGCTPVVVASPTELPVNGMPYDENVRHFFSAKPNLVAAAKNTFNHYDGLTGADRTCTMAVYDMSKIDAIASAARDFYTSLNSPSLAHDAAPQRFMLDSKCYLYDFGHYIDLLAESNKDSDPMIARKAGNLKKALADALQYSANTPRLWSTLAINYYSGFSSFIISTESDISFKNYNNLQWYKDIALNLIK